MRAITDSAVVGEIMTSLIEWHQDINSDPSELMVRRRDVEHLLL